MYNSQFLSAHELFTFHDLVLHLAVGEAHRGLYVSAASGSPNLKGMIMTKFPPKMLPMNASNCFLLELIDSKYPSGKLAVVCLRNWATEFT